MPSRVILNPDGPNREQLEPIVTRHLRSGDVLRFEQSGGGGYGLPQERDEARVRTDVLNGYVSREAAQLVYGRHISDTVK